MKKSLLVGVLIAAAVQPVCAADLLLTLARPQAGQWQAFGQLSNNTDNDGLASLIIDVGAVSGDLAVSSSTCELPYGTHYWLDGGVQSQLVGFTEFRSNGTSGIGIRAGQKTTSLGQVVLTGVGYSSGSYPGDETGQNLGPTLISWSAPVLIASGSYGGLYGMLSVAVGAGQVNVLDDGRNPAQPGGVHQIETVTGGQLRIYCPGDANGDDHVDGSDLAIMGGNWMTPSGMTWADADFNGDGAVDGSDLALMGGYWEWSASPAPPAALEVHLPEPATMVLLGLGAVTLLARRR
ncbi:MAG: dockerin type I domain-containing protein [Phycisphaerae bacterium]|nr:dockerin type I domain-containing protein [Phycisphaerae bacterium]